LKSKSSEPQTAEQGYHYSLRLLTGRDYTAVRIRNKLAARDISGQDIETIIVRLQEEGWLDDRRYARRFAESALAEGRFYGPRLRLEMRRRGFSPEVVAEILSPLLAERDEVPEVRQVLEKRYPGFCYSAASDRDKRRVLAFLQRRGFGFPVIMQALRTDV